MSGVFAEYEYRFYSWGEDAEEPLSTSWNKLDKSIKKLDLTVLMGTINLRLFQLIRLVIVQKLSQK